MLKTLIPPKFVLNEFFVYVDFSAFSIDAVDVVTLTHDVYLFEGGFILTTISDPFLFLGDNISPTLVYLPVIL